MKFPRNVSWLLLLSLSWIAPRPAGADGFRMEFLWKTDRKEEHLSLLRRGPYIRIDQPANLFSLIYNVELQSFLGLEHLDAHFWSFDWPTIHASTKASREARWRLHADPFPDDPTLVPFRPSPPPSAPRAAVFHELARFSWARERGPGDRWLGHSDAGAEARIFTTTLETDRRAPWLSTAEQMKTLSQISHFLLGREAWPESVLAIWLSLPPESGFPREISWRKDDGEEGALRLLSQQWTEPQPDLFTAPKGYQRESLEEIEGFLP